MLIPNIDSTTMPASSREVHSVTMRAPARVRRSMRPYSSSSGSSGGAAAHIPTLSRVQDKQGTNHTQLQLLNMRAVVKALLKGDVRMDTHSQSQQRHVALSEHFQ
jgi:hypothetical protein